MCLTFDEAESYMKMIAADAESDRVFNAALQGIEIKASGSSKATGTLRSFHSRMADRIKRKGR